MSRRKSCHFPQYSDKNMSPNITDNRITRRSFNIPTWHEVRQFAKDLTHFRSNKTRTNEDSFEEKGRRQRAITESPTSLKELVSDNSIQQNEEENKRFLFGIRRHSYDAMDCNKQNTVHSNESNAHLRTQAFYNDVGHSRFHRRSRMKKKMNVNESEVCKSHSKAKNKEKYKRFFRISKIATENDMDYDLLQERKSFTKKAQEKTQTFVSSPTETESSTPVEFNETLNLRESRHVTFQDPLIYETLNKDLYAKLEHYEDIFVRVARFPIYDQRRQCTKMKEFLERTLAFLNVLETKHGFVHQLTNDEIRMWRRVIAHNWQDEENTLTDRLSLVNEESDRNDTLFRWEIPSELEQLERIVEIVNACLNFGEIPFSLLNIAKLCQLELKEENEEDGWL